MSNQNSQRHRWRRGLIQLIPKESQIKKGYVPYTLYDTALSEAAYGMPRQQRRARGKMLGDMFGDIMGAVVGKENWDARPDWMKRMQVKPDPAKLFTAASKAVPPRLVGKVVGQANRAGFDMFYNTPAGSIPITPEMAEGVYGNYPAFLRTKDVFSSVPVWVYALGAGGILLAFMMRK